ncbi:MAG: GNAT family N-acetyltransferase [Theionarchaea archaeon]|nr:GNAT family N-acetyltransferase [Theionarchaea archaeon]
MDINYRTLNPGEEEKAMSLIEKGYGFAPMPHFRWKLFENPCWDYEYSVVGESDGNLVAIMLLEPVKMKFLDKTIDVLVGGGATVHPDFRRRGLYTYLVTSSADVSFGLGKPMFVLYALQNDFTFTVLKKRGFFHLFSQKKYVKILDVRKTVALAAERLNKTGFLGNLSLNIRIDPDSGEPFLVIIRKGIVSLRNSPDSDSDSSKNDICIDVDISGNIKKMVAFLINGKFKEIIWLLATRKVKVRFRLQSLRNIARMVKMVIS